MSPPRAGDEAGAAASEEMLRGLVGLPRERAATLLAGAGLRVHWLPADGARPESIVRVIRARGRDGTVEVALGAFRPPRTVGSV